MFRLLLIIFVLINFCPSFGQEFTKGGLEFHKNLEKSINARLLRPSDNWIGRDKAKHFLASMLITGGSMWVAKNKWGIDAGSSRNFGISVGISAAFAKEILDKNGRTAHFSWRDIAADFLGIIAGGILLSW